MDRANLLLYPASFRACSRCHNRKVKCDGRVPSCTTCAKSNAECNITSHVTYSYGAVCELQARILELEGQLRRAESNGDQAQRPSAQGERYAERLQNSASGPDQEILDSIAEEVGNLTVGTTNNRSQIYIGSAAGASFARIFFKQLDLNLVSFQVSVSSGSQDAPDLAASHASLPPKRIGEYLLTLYVARVHVWWPAIHLPSLRRWFVQIYSASGACDSFQRYVIFMVMAISSLEARETLEYNELHDIFAPSEYFATASRFLDQIVGTTFQGLQGILLLAIWMTRSLKTSDNANLWQVGRFAMSMAIELGCHRNNPKWNFGSVEKEMRNRVWWCTYALERTIAVATGRVLSIRNHAIDAPFPQITEDDVLTPAESAISPTLSQKGFLPAIHLFRLRSIGGDILESVYIARPRARTALSLSDTIDIADGLRQRLANWYSALGECSISGSRESLELKIELCMTILLLNRPSPSFPSPSEQAVEACAEASREALESWATLLEKNQLSVAWSTFHDVLLTGFSWLYCAWRLPELEEPVIEHSAKNCSNILLYSKGDDRENLKYVHFFKIVQDATIERCRRRGVEAIKSLGQQTQENFDTEWMGEYFDEVFLNSDATFDLDFTVDENLFQGPHISD